VTGCAINAICGLRLLQILVYAEIASNKQKNVIRKAVDQQIAYCNAACQTGSALQARRHLPQKGEVETPAVGAYAAGESE
jgi:hypothetical protein